MNALDNPGGSNREIDLSMVGLALIARNFTIWAELTNPWMNKQKLKLDIEITQPNKTTQ